MPPLSPHGKRQLARLEETYGPETAKRVLYASKNAGKKGFTNIDRGKKRKHQRRKGR